jgi:hypothetical protein
MMNETPDVAIVLRPDVQIAGRLWIRWRVLSLAIKARAQRPEIQAPAWGSFGGVNDRFAVMSWRLAERYMGRVENIDSWVRIGKPFDPEKFLAFSMKGSKIKRSIYTPMFRIRIGGRLEEADLSFFETPAVIARLRDSATKAYRRFVWRTGGLRSNRTRVWHFLNRAGITPMHPRDRSATARSAKRPR